MSESRSWRCRDCSRVVTVTGLEVDFAKFNPGCCGLWMDEVVPRGEEESLPPHYTACHKAWWWSCDCGSRWPVGRKTCGHCCTVRRLESGVREKNRHLAAEEFLNSEMLPTP